MKRAGPSAPTTRGRRLLIRIVGWTLAVPALCAAAVVGGAMPLYLLLPAAEPAATGVVETARTHAPAPRPASPAAAEPAAPGVSQASEAVEELAAGQASADAAPAEDAPDARAETIAATVVPTPRPAAPMPAGGPEAGSPREAAAAVPAAPEQRAQAPLQGRRMMVRTAAKLRDAPQGAEIGVVPGGSEIVVGRCERWCEVSADGRRGYVHASLLDDGTRRNAERRIGARPAGRRPADERWIDRGPDAYDRAGYGRPYDDRPYVERRIDAPRDYDRRFRERAYRRGEDPDWLRDDRDRRAADPGWSVEDPLPIARRDPPALLYYEPYP